MQQVDLFVHYIEISHLSFHPVSPHVRVHVKKDRQSPKASITSGALLGILR